MALQALELQARTSLCRDWEHFYNQSAVLLDELVTEESTRKRKAVWHLKHLHYTQVVVSGSRRVNPAARLQWSGSIVCGLTFVHYFISQVSFSTCILEVPVLHRRSAPQVLGHQFPSPQRGRLSWAARVLGTRSKVPRLDCGSQPQKFGNLRRARWIPRGIQSLMRYTGKWTKRWRRAARYGRPTVWDQCAPRSARHSQPPPPPVPSSIPTVAGMVGAGGNGGRGRPVPPAQSRF